MPRELSIFIDESGDFGPYEAHAPYYVLSLVLHDQSDDIAPHLSKIHDALATYGLPRNHAIHTGPLIRREKDYATLSVGERRAIFRTLFTFVRECEISHHSWLFSKREHRGSDELVSSMSRELGALIRENYAYFMDWHRIVIYYDNGQKEITNLVNSVFNALLNNVEVRKVQPSEYSLFQAADLCCTLTLLKAKMQKGGLSRSENEFLSTPKASAERTLKRVYLSAMERKTFGS